MASKTPLALAALLATFSVSPLRSASGETGIMDSKTPVAVETDTAWEKFGFPPPAAAPSLKTDRDPGRQYWCRYGPPRAE